jgi:hypothetical protein
MNIRLAAALSSLLIATLSEAQQSILVDGDFATVAPSGSTGSIRYCGGSMGAWVIPVGQGVEVFNPSVCGCDCGGGPCYGYVGCAPLPGAYLRLHNNYWQCSYGSTTSILQEVPVVPGALYEFEIYAASELGNTIEVSDGVRTYQFVTGNEWQQFKAVLKWTASIGTLSVTRANIGANNPCSGPFVAHLSLIPRGPDCNGNMVPDDEEPDCNRNGIPDYCDVASGTSTDFDHDETPDECQCIADLFIDGAVNGVDLGALLGYWGPTTSASASQRCDLNRDGAVDGVDLGILLGAWGPCIN